MKEWQDLSYDFKDSSHCVKNGPRGQSLEVSQLVGGCCNIPERVMTWN